MKILTLIFLIIALYSCTNKTKNTEQIIFARIEYIFNLKPIISKQIWSDFDNKIYDLPGLTIFNITGTAQITSIHFSC